MLNIQHYKVRIKGKVKQSRKRSSALPYSSMFLLLKREPSGCPRLWSPTFDLLSFFSGLNKLMQQARISWALSETIAVLLGIHDGRSNTKTSMSLGVSSKTESYWYWWKPNIQYTSARLGWSQAMETLWLYSSPHMTSDTIQLLPAIKGLKTFPKWTQ